jgi:SnoaL-like domain
MSRENEQTLRAFLKNLEDIPTCEDALKRGDADVAPLDPDVLYEDANLPDHIGESYRGPEGILRAAERWADASATLTLELKRIVGSGDHLVSIHAAHSKARHTGSSSTRPSPTPGPSATEGSFTSSRIVTRRRPSTPPGCRSR